VLDVRAERLERVEMGVQPAPADHVTAWRRQQRLAEARQQRAGDQERCTDPLGEPGIDGGLGHRVRLQGDGVAVAPLDLHAEILEQHH
jgi:hypothetical protein